MKVRISDDALSYDMRSPPPSSRATSNVMKANRGRDTKPELLMRRALRDVGLGGYRLNWKNAPGRPDISYPGRKVAIFVNGCYWHRCPYCNPSTPNSNKRYWRWKFTRNKERDERKKKEIKRLGWKVFTFWECLIKRDPIKYAKKVMDYTLG